MPKNAGKYHTETEKRICSTVWRHVLSEDLPDVTITQICQEAGISRDTFYRHYDSPQEAILESIATQQAELLRRWDNGSGQFSVFLNNMLNYVSARRKSCRCLLSFNRVGLKQNVIEVFADEMSRFGYFDAARTRTIPDFGSEVLVLGFVNAFFESLLMWIQESYRTDRAEIQRYMLELYDRMIL